MSQLTREPAAIGDALAAEPGHADGFGAAVWHHGATLAPFTIQRTSIPGNVRLDLSAVDHHWNVMPDLPVLDLSWTPPDVDAVLAAILTAVGVPDGPWGDGTLNRQEFMDALHNALAWPDDDATAVMPLVNLNEEEQ